MLANRFNLNYFRYIALIAVQCLFVEKSKRPLPNKIDPHGQALSKAPPRFAPEKSRF
jgi:hypothetical protein